MKLTHKMMLMTPLLWILGGCAGMRKESPVIGWVGHPMISDGNQPSPVSGWLTDIQMGLRADGTMVWRKVQVQAPPAAPAPVATPTPVATPAPTPAAAPSPAPKPAVRHHRKTK